MEWPGVILGNNTPMGQIWTYIHTKTLFSIKSYSVIKALFFFQENINTDDSTDIIPRVRVL